jgi:hypothetical protein
MCENITNLLIDNSLFKNSSTKSRGGSIFLSSGVIKNSIFNIKNSNFTDNIGIEGGAFYI